MFDWYSSKVKPRKNHQEKIWILDYSFYIYNGSFAFKRPCSCNGANKSCIKCEGSGHLFMQSKSGIRTGGLFHVFNNILNRIADGYKVITVFDPPKEQLDRMKLLDSYKGNRPDVPEWITYQMDLGQDLLLHTGIDCFYSDHDESDDVIATIALEKARNGAYVVVASDDKDMFPLLGHENIDLYRQKSLFTVSSFHEYMKKKSGIEIKDPSRFNEFLAICGDAADNFNLLEGLGPKAAEWIIANSNKSCLEVFNKLDKVPNKYLKKLIRCTKPENPKDPKANPCPKGTDCIDCKYYIKGNDKKSDMELSLQIATLNYKATYRNINRNKDKAKVEKALLDLDMHAIIKNINDLF